MDKPSGGLVGTCVGEEIRCPACARLLVLRSGPAVTAHYAHRPRQSCRNRPGRPRSSPIRLEQLTLFELEPVALPRAVARSDSSGYSGPAPARPAPDPSGLDELSGVEPSGSPAAPRRRRRAWLPRLIRWVKARRR